MTNYQQNAGSQWGYWQGKDYYEIPETRLHKFCRRGIAAMLVAGILAGATYQALGAHNILEIFSSKSSDKNIETVVMQR